MNVVLYLRYSSDAQTEQSIEGQRRVCQEFCARSGYTIVGEYVDRAASASHDTDKRVHFLNMIRDSALGRFEAVIVYKLDRFARNRYDSATYKNKLAKNGVRVVSATENISDTPDGIILESILEGMAEYYSKELSQKVRRGMKESALKANSCGGALPLGYKIEGKKYVEDPLTSPIVKELFSRYAAGERIADINRDFNERGFRTRSGKTFNRSSWHNTLSNRRYLGIYIYNGIEVPGGMPQLIDDDTFHRVQDKLQIVSAKPSHGKASELYELSDKAFCGLCGCALIGDSGRSATGSMYHYYTCASRKKDRSCALRPLPKDLLETAVAEDAASLLTPSLIEQIADAALRAAEAERAADTSIPAIKQELSDINRRIDNLLRLVEAGSTAGSLVSRLDDLDGERTALKRRLEAAEAQHVSLERDQVVWFLSHFLGGDLSNPDFRHEILHLFVSRVTVTDDESEGTDSARRRRKRPVCLEIAYNLVPGTAHTAKLIAASGSDSSDSAAIGSPIKPYPNISIVDNGRILIHTIKRRVE